MLKLPKEISIERGVFQGFPAYYVHSTLLGRVGGVVVMDTENGQSALNSFISGGDDAPNADARKAIVKAVSDQLSLAVLDKMNVEIESSTHRPYEVVDGKIGFESKHILCSNCNQIYARLIFWPKAHDLASMEDAVRTTYEYYSVYNCPVWIIGSPDSSDDQNAKHITLRVWPERSDIEWLHPSVVNDELDSLGDAHCSHLKL